METSSKFSKAEIVFTAINCVIAKLFLIFPSVFPAISASSAVILALFTVLSGFMFVYLTSFLYNNKKTDIIRICKNAKVKTALSLLFIFTFIINQSIFVRSVAESLKISLLPGSPLMYITIIFMTGVFICAYTGLKSIIRVHSLIVPFTIFMA
ncbi:MAG: GerAB/ArcD/ProY family transporter, partial [Clostridia bacterium]|nr:GerAB/ArcD/ProY family transporter [Clostridia bacterium]